MAHLGHLVGIYALNIIKYSSPYSPEAEAKAGRIVYGRLKRAPKLPSKPESPSSSSDDLSGSEESSSDDIDENAEQNARNAKEAPTKVNEFLYIIS